MATTVGFTTPPQRLLGPGKRCPGAPRRLGFTSEPVYATQDEYQLTRAWDAATTDAARKLVLVDIKASFRERGLMRSLALKVLGLGPETTEAQLSGIWHGSCSFGII